jgi:hypothetical protein
MWPAAGADDVEACRHFGRAVSRSIYAPQMASADLSRRVGKAVACSPLCEMSDLQRREFHEALIDADTFEDLAGSGRRRS